MTVALVELTLRGCVNPDPISTAVPVCCSDQLCDHYGVGRHGSGATIPRPDRYRSAFKPEGITIGPGATAYVGSLATGDIHAVNLRTGELRLVSDELEPPSVGLKIGKQDHLFGAGGTSGTGRVVDIGDGLLVQGNTLYVVQNRLNQIAVFKINADGTSGELLRVLTSEDLDESVTFDVPTTVARFGSSLYLPNARFGTVSDPSAEKYWITRVDIH